MVDSAVFVGAIVVALVDALKDLSPKVKGWVTVVVAALVGALVAILGKQLGVTHISIAQGILDGLGAAGVVGVAKRVG